MGLRAPREQGNVSVAVKVGPRDVTSENASAIQPTSRSSTCGQQSLIVEFRDRKRTAF